MWKEILIDIILGLAIGTIIFHGYRIWFRKKCCRLRDEYLVKITSVQKQCNKYYGKRNLIRLSDLKKLQATYLAMSQHYGTMKKICHDCLTFQKESEIRNTEIEKWIIQNI